jgi:hypothetical protein
MEPSPAAAAEEERRPRRVAFAKETAAGKIRRSVALCAQCFALACAAGTTVGVVVLAYWFYCAVVYYDGYGAPDRLAEIAPGSTDASGYPTPATLARSAVVAPLEASRQHLIYRFNHPNIVNADIMDNGTSACADFFGHACGNWPHAYNRMFGSTMRENEADLDAVDRLITASEDAARAYTVIISPDASTFTSGDNSSSSSFTRQDDEQMLLNMLESQQQQQESAAGGSRDGKIAFNINMNRFYRSCVSYFMGGKDAKSAAVLFAHLKKRMESFRSALLGNATRPSSLGRAWGLLESGGYRSPIDLAVLEVPYSFSQADADDGDGAPRRRDVLLHLEQSGLFYDVIGPDQVVGKFRSLLMHGQDTLEELIGASRGDGAALDHRMLNAFLLQLQLARLHSNFSHSHSGGGEGHRHGNDDNRSWKETLDDFKRYYSIVEYGQLRDRVLQRSRGVLDLDDYMAEAAPGRRAPDRTERVSVMSARYMDRLADWIGASRERSGSDQWATQWSDYALFMTMRSLLDRVPEPLMATLASPAKDDKKVARICLAHTKRLFPTSYCHAFRTATPGFAQRKRRAVGVAKQVLDTIANDGFIDEVMIGGFGLCQTPTQKPQWGTIDSATLHRNLKSHLDTLEVSIDECFMGDRSRHLSHDVQRQKALIRSELSLKMFDSAYVYNLLLLGADEAMRMQRHGSAERNPDRVRSTVSKHTISLAGSPLHESFSEVNAWYDGVYHRVIIPPGILRPMVFSELYDDTSLMATLGFELAHELAHSTEMPMFNANTLKSTSSCAIRSYYGVSQAYMALLDFYQRRRDPHYGERCFYENRADWIAAHASYRIWKQNVAGNGDERSFWLALAQLWCARESADTRLDDVHALASHRVRATVGHMLRYFASLRAGFEDTFGCQLSRD